jgi:hypothetical protein
MIADFAGGAEKISYRKHNISILLFSLDAFIFEKFQKKRACLQEICLNC